MYVLAAMSTTQSRAADRVTACGPEEATAVRIHADDLESTSPEYLRDLKYDLAREGYVPAAVEADARFEEDCSLATQEEAERVRDVVRAAAFLGAGRVALSVESVADEGKVRPALEACAERARREGVTLAVTGAIELDG